MHFHPSQCHFVKEPFEVHGEHYWPILHVLKWQTLFAPRSRLLAVLTNECQIMAAQCDSGYSGDMISVIPGNTTTVSSVK